MAVAQKKLREQYVDMSGPPVRFADEIENGRETPLAASRVRLAKVIEEGVEPPEELEGDVLLKGRVHSVYAAGGDGKTFFMIWIVKRCVERGEKVVVFDAENGSRIVSERLAALGVDTRRLDDLLIYHAFPDLTSDAERAGAYADLLDEEAPSLVVFDSLVNFIGSAGLDENSNDDIVKWAVRFTRPARERGIAVLLLDHVPHGGDHARGASRKKDEVDVMWALKKREPFDRETVGRIELRRVKDREGWLPERVSFSVGGTDSGFVFRRRGGTTEETNPEDGLSDLERVVLETLRDDIGQEGARANEWMWAAKKRKVKNRKVSEASFWRAKRTIMARDLVTVTADKGFLANPTPRLAADGSGEFGLSVRDSASPSQLSNNYQDIGDGGTATTTITLRGGDSSGSPDPPDDTGADRVGGHAATDDAGSELGGSPRAGETCRSNDGGVGEPGLEKDARPGFPIRPSRGMPSGEAAAWEEV